MVTIAAHCKIVAKTAGKNIILKVPDLTGEYLPNNNIYGFGNVAPQGFACMATCYPSGKTKLVSVLIDNTTIELDIESMDNLATESDFRILITGRYFI